MHLDERLQLQAGVISRRQALAAGLADHDVRRLVRRREWASLFEGVYVDHTGRPSWLQRAWGAVLFAAPAALARESALRALDGPGRRVADDRTIWVAIDTRRRVAGPSGVRICRVAGLGQKVLWNVGPPRMRTEEAVLDVAGSTGRDIEAIAVLADAVQARRTTAGRLLTALEGRARVPRRAFVRGVLLDVRDGTCSALEHAYLDRVERPHGLPRASRQVPAWSEGRIHRDVEYDDFDLVVELDGRLFHDDAAARDRDLDRDLVTAIGGRSTIRLGWGQVFDRPCTTAHRVGSLLTRHGWSGVPTTCSACPEQAIGA